MPEGQPVATRDGVRVAVRVAPQAKEDRTVAVGAVAEGRRGVNARVIAPAEDEGANAALLRLLARRSRVPRRNLAILTGAASRHNTVYICGGPQRLTDRLGALLAALPRG